MAMTSTSSSTLLLYPSQQQPQWPLGSNEIEPTATNANLLGVGKKTEPHRVKSNQPSQNQFKPNQSLFQTIWLKISPTRMKITEVPTPVYGPNHYSTGSIGPFFAVISVLVVLAVLSCFLGWIRAHRRQRTALVAEANPCGLLLWWVGRKCKRCLDRDVEAAAKVADCFWQRNAKRW
ncbi:hypothetical protein YC2023_078825 [Brassica napus]